MNNNNIATITGGTYNTIVGGGPIILSYNSRTNIPPYLIGKNQVPETAHKLIAIGDGIELTEEDEINNAVYIGGNSKVFMKIGDKFVNIVDKLTEMEDKLTEMKGYLDMLLYAPGGPMYEVAKESFRLNSEIDKT